MSKQIPHKNLNQITKIYKQIFIRNAKKQFKLIIPKNTNETLLNTETGPKIFRIPKKSLISKFSKIFRQISIKISEGFHLKFSHF